jgi:hypothetical protein
MNRSPLFYPLNRNANADAGGAADLQTDVMRFMAILSLCLVAIFALVQSIPLTPAQDPEPIDEAGSAEAAESTETVAREEPEPPVDVPEQVALTRPAPVRTVETREKISLQRPDPGPARESAPAPGPQAAEPSMIEAAPAKQGFTLQFENDAALTRLVARQRVGLYAITNAQTSRMSVEDDMISFWPSSLPGAFHEMDEATVPDDVVAAYVRGKSPLDITWGVTLPADMSRELDHYLASTEGGTLVIAANGKIGLRH